MQDSENRLTSLYRRFDNIAAALDSYSNVSETMTEGGRVLKEQASLLLHEARRALRSRWDRLDPRRFAAGRGPRAQDRPAGGSGRHAAFRVAAVTRTRETIGRAARAVADGAALRAARE